MPTICMNNLNNVFEVRLFGLLIVIIEHGMKQMSSLLYKNIIGNFIGRM